MKISYDKIADAVYIYLKRGKISHSINVNDRMVVDVDGNDDVVGIEILDFSINEGGESLQQDIKNGVPIEIISRTPVLV